MLVLSITLAAVLIAAAGDDQLPPAGAGPPASRPETAPGLGAAPLSPMPVTLLDQVQTLPDRLRAETLQGYSTGALGLQDVEQIVYQYQNRNPAVRVGAVVDVSGGTLRIEVFTTGEETAIATGEQTLVRRGDRQIALDDLVAGELVMVVSAADGSQALTIEAFGVAAP